MCVNYSRFRAYHLSIICLVFTCFYPSVIVAQDRIYLMSSSNSDIDNTTKTFLEATGFQVDIGQQYRNYNGLEDLSPYDAVLLFCNANWGLDMPAAGQSALVAYISNGGGLVTTEWVHWQSAGSSFQILKPALPAFTDSTFNNEFSRTYTKVSDDAIMNFNLPDSFTFSTDSFGGTETEILPKENATVFWDSSNLEAGVVGWDFGVGRCLSLSTVSGLQALENEDYQQLVRNSLSWVITENNQSTCPENPVGDLNNDCRVNLLDIHIIAANWMACNLLPATACDP